MERNLFIPFDRRFISSVKAYCFQHPLETIAISSFLLCLERQEANCQPDARLYLYFEEDEIKALIFFSEKGVMHISNHSENLYAKVDFLKTIHKEKPKLVKGMNAEVDRLFYFLQRALKSFEFYPSYLMQYKGQKQGRKSDNIKLSQIVDWQKNSSFLLAVENFFRADALSINYLKQKTQKAKDIDFYYVYASEDRVLGQIIGEMSSFCYGILAALFVASSERRKGVAKELLLAGIEHYLAMNITPLLYVARDNKEALALYQKLGFETVAETLEMELML